MKPTHWLIQYVDPKTQTTHTSKPYVQRSQARGAAIIAKALGMQSVNLIAKWKEYARASSHNSSRECGHRPRARCPHRLASLPVTHDEQT